MNKPKASWKKKTGTSLSQMQINLINTEHPSIINVTTPSRISLLNMA
jgi:hypothetical protein